MKHVDYIIVGCGLAGIALCEHLRLNNKSFVVFENGSQQSSTVAGGLYNPVVLKRFTPVWKSKEQLKIALPFYKQLENLLKCNLDYKLPVLRMFNSIEEQNNWFAASDNPLLSEYLSTKIIENTNPIVKASYGYGKVLQTGRVDTHKLMLKYRSFLDNTYRLFNEVFNYDIINIEEDYISYNSIKAKYIVFAEGYGLKQNPFFNYLPLKGTKGELLTIKAPDLKINFVLKAGVFLIPLGNDLYRVGATYEWEDKTNKITALAKQELLEKLDKVINCNYEVVGQLAGIRPTVIDRRPLVGQHKDYKNLFVLNGLGTRGVMIAPYISKELFDYIEENKALNPEINIARF